MQVINKRKVGEQGKAIKVNENIGQITEGIYRGFVPVASKIYQGKTNNLYTILVNGESQSFFGNSGLDRRLAEVKVGDWVSITYKGKIRLQNGNQFHNYGVETGEVMDDSEENPISHKTPKNSDSVTDEEQGLELPF